MDGLWDDRLTQEMIDEKFAAAVTAKAADEALTIAQDLELEAFLEPEPLPEPESEQTPLEVMGKVVGQPHENWAAEEFSSTGMEAVVQSPSLCDHFVRQKPMSSDQSWLRRTTIIVER